jgi:hypothetical protein
MMNYRAYKVPRANLTLLPADAPALYTYARTTSSPTVFYMSWNGASEITQWRILSRSSCDDSWSELAVVDKTGFETRYRAEAFVEFGLVEALFDNGTAIRNSTLKGTRTFVPSALLAESCGEDGCDEADEYEVPGDEEQARLSEEVPRLREACPATPQALEEERERLEEQKEERESGGEGEEDAAGGRSRGVVSWAAVAAALVGAGWVMA